MLFPGGVLLPDSIGGFDILLLKCCEKLVCGTPLRIIPQVIYDPREDESCDYCSDGEISPTTGARLVELLRIHERHDLSIMESAAIEKVPEKQWLEVSG